MMKYMVVSKKKKWIELTNTPFVCFITNSCIKLNNEFPEKPSKPTSWKKHTFFPRQLQTSVVNLDPLEVLYIELYIHIMLILFTKLTHIVARNCLNCSVEQVSSHKKP